MRLGRAVAALLLVASARDASGARAAGAVDEVVRHPLLVVTRQSDPLTRYLTAILRAEGFNGFAEIDVGVMDSAVLASHRVVVLARMPVDQATARALAGWVERGGVLVAMRPDTVLRSLFALGAPVGVSSDRYWRVDSRLAVTRGITQASMQFHGTADVYEPGLATPLALLHPSGADEFAARHPAVSVALVGARGGAAIAFTFDVARSVMNTRQGNPAWVGQERDARPPLRANDLFYPDYLDRERIGIPQADELQRMLSNVLVHFGSPKVPIPRFWYLPRGLNAAVLMAADDHGRAVGTQRFFDMLLDASAPGCRVEEWECQRATSWIYPTVPMSDSVMAAYVSRGFELGMHVRARADTTRNAPTGRPGCLMPPCVETCGNSANTRHRCHRSAPCVCTASCGAIGARCPRWSANTAFCWT